LAESNPPQLRAKTPCHQWHHSIESTAV